MANDFLKSLATWFHILTFDLFRKKKPEHGERYPSSLRWIDPPQGWRYGFPRIFNVDGEDDLEKFLYRFGYPPDDIDFAMKHMRIWPATQDEFEEERSKHRC